MINGSPRWTVLVTHNPSGITVTRDSNHYRYQYQAKDAAIKYLKSKLAYAYKGVWDNTPLPQEDIKYSYLFPEDVTHPRDPKEFRREVE